MPLGSKHDETGLLLWEGNELTLQRDGGGRWRLNGPRALETLAGYRVRLTGTRSGFDWLDVRSFEQM